MKDYAPGSNRVCESYFKHEGQSQGHKVIDVGVIWKGIISKSMHAKYEVSSSHDSKVMAKVKVDNKQTNRQDIKYAPDHSIRGHKNYNIVRCVWITKWVAKERLYSNDFNYTVAYL